MPQHVLHEEMVACQVCHSAGPYKSCCNCHGQSALFRLAGDVDPDQLEANRDVIAVDVPASQ